VRRALRFYGQQTARLLLQIAVTRNLIICAFLAGVMLGCSLSSAQGERFTSNDTDHVYQVGKSWGNLRDEISNIILTLDPKSNDTQCLSSIVHEIDAIGLSVASLQFLTTISASMRHDDDEATALTMTLRAINAIDRSVADERRVLTAWFGVCRFEPVTVEKIRDALALLSETQTLLQQLRARILAVQR
jgi:hypothetical protein